jgi:hypothetical protein
LLILDNCEHLLDACAVLADSLLHTCPDLKVLATSREALGIGGKTVLQVPPLPVPQEDPVPPPEALLRYDAVRLLWSGPAPPGHTLTSRRLLPKGGVSRSSAASPGLGSAAVAAPSGWTALAALAASLPGWRFRWSPGWPPVAGSGGTTA